MDVLSPALRPELLRSLLAQLPLTGAAVTPAAVASVCGALEAHALLAEVAPASGAAVDALFQRVLALAAAQQARGACA